MTIPTWRQLSGSAVVARALIGQRRRSFLPRKQIETIRDRQVRRLIRYAAAKVPYYRDWFAAQGLDPRAIEKASDLNRLPILDKERVRTQPEQFRAQGSLSRGAQSYLTSGTTGVPIEIWHDRNSLLANIAYGERERDPINQLCGGSFRPRELYVGYETSTFKLVTDFYKKNVRLPVEPRRRFVSLSTPIDEIATMINAEQPDILVGYGGWIELFFRTAAARGIDLHLPKMVMYMGEALPFGARDYIEGELGVPVLSRYNAVEAFKIGFYCQQRQGFHIHEDLCHLRIVDANGRDVADGESGQVVISNLVNRASVLINYPMGDMASISPTACSCGRSFRLFSELQGRTEDILTLEDGRFVHPRTVWQLFKDEREVLQYQLIQHEAQRFELLLVTMDEAAFPHVLQRVLPGLQDLLGTQAKIEPQWRLEFVRQPGQKFRAVVSAQRRS
jgi:phenylacetate-CoA ligase